MSHLRMLILPILLAVALATGCSTNTIPASPVPTNTNSVSNSNVNPTLEIIPSPTYPFDNHLNPMGAPLRIWKDIPVMPKAIAGEEYQDGSYSYTVNKSIEEVQDFYMQELIPNGWKPLNSEFQVKGDGTVGVFEKGITIINITISPSPNNSDDVVVILHNN